MSDKTGGRQRPTGPCQGSHTLELLLGSLISKGCERVFQLLFTRIPAGIVPVFDGSLVILPEPVEYLLLPICGKSLFVPDA